MDIWIKAVVNDFGQDGKAINVRIRKQSGIYDANYRHRDVYNKKMMTRKKELEISSGRLVLFGTGLLGLSI